MINKNFPNYDKTSVPVKVISSWPAEPNRAQRRKEVALAKKKK